MTVYFNSEYLKKEDVKISPDDRGFLFGDGAYEVIRCYHGNLFMFEDHINRLNYSLAELKIDCNTSDFESVIRKLISINNFQNSDIVIYIQITRGVAPRSLAFPKEKTNATVYVTTSEINNVYYSYKEGIKAVFVDDIRWNRCDIKSVNLLANVIAHNQALEKNAQIGLFVKNGIITEGTHVGVFGVKNNCLVTHPSGKDILPSITRKVIFQLCEKLKIPILEEAVTIDNVFDLDELFVVGTSPEIAPVIFLEGKEFGNGKPGQITIRLQREFGDLLMG